MPRGPAACFVLPCLVLRGNHFVFSLRRLKQIFLWALESYNLTDNQVRISLIPATKFSILLRNSSALPFTTVRPFKNSVTFIHRFRNLISLYPRIWTQNQQHVRVQRTPATGPFDSSGTDFVPSGVYGVSLSTKGHIITRWASQNSSSVLKVK